MKHGDRVRHKLSGEIFTLTRISECVAVLRRDKPEITRFGDEVWTAVCLLENLELESSGGSATSNPPFLVVRDKNGESSA